MKKCLVELVIAIVHVDQFPLNRESWEKILVINTSR